MRAKAALRRRIRGRSKLALVCAGGGITGAVYEIGCLRALEELLDRSLMDFDTYVGVSGGAFVTSLLGRMEPTFIDGLKRCVSSIRASKR